jgi:hypothetical protein
MLDGLFLRLRSVFRRQTVESEMDDELRFHGERQSEKFLNAGISRDQARRQARLDFGGLDQVKQNCRDARGVSPVETLVQALGFGRRTPLR